MINISIKDKLLITFILVFLCTFIIFKYINKGVKNVLSVYAVNEIKTESTLLINESINNLEVGNYEEYINVVKNKDDEIISHLSGIMATDFEISEVKKCINDVIISYEKDKLIIKRNEIIKKLENTNELTKDEIANLEKELSELIIKLARIK